MLDRISFEHESGEGMTATRWSFYLLRETLVVDSYMEVARSSRRKKYSPVRVWSRLNGRDNTMAQSDVPLTSEIAQEAQDRFIQQLKSTLSVGFQNP